MEIYTGIGSRETPPNIKRVMSALGEMLANRGLTLRSGSAPGADQAFEFGCDRAKGNKEIYLPWRGFEGSKSSNFIITDAAMELAKKHHKYWHNLSDGGKKLQARNGYQVLGLDLKTPTDFVICWTPDGSGSGGTGQAIRVAEAYKIPLFDMGKCNWSDLVPSLKSFLKEVSGASVG